MRNIWPHEISGDGSRGSDCEKQDQVARPFNTCFRAGHSPRKDGADHGSPRRLLFEILQVDRGYRPASRIAAICSRLGRKIFHSHGVYPTTVPGAARATGSRVASTIFLTSRNWWKGFVRKHVVERVRD